MDGEIKIVITPQLVHDIFEEFPIVARAYNDTVPGKVHIPGYLSLRLTDSPEAV